MKRNVMVIFVHVCILFILAGLIIGKPANAVELSHEGTATVKAIDLEKGIVRLAHGPIASLNWPSMIMNFRIKEQALLQEIKVNDHVAFTFIHTDGHYVVTHIQVVK